jgi:pimeloyl-ACP methyl ester carboxylesterase
MSDHKSLAPLEHMITVAGAELCVETFGDNSDPAVLLMMGATASLVWWPTELCRALAARGRFVLRYDNRDTGRSTSYPPGPPPYSIDDMASDALAILDAFGIERAVLAGVSLGGYIAQLVALRAPARVSRLVLISSLPLGPDDPTLPPIEPHVMEYLARGASLDYSDRAAVVAHSVGGWRLLAGPKRPFEEAAVTARAEHDFDRARSPQSASNHALLAGGEAFFGRLGELKMPTTVIHGTHDPVLSYQHGQAIARQIPNARLIRLDGAGHELHALDWPAIIEAITGANAPAR